MNKREESPNLRETFVRKARAMKKSYLNSDPFRRMAIKNSDN